MLVLGKSRKVLDELQTECTVKSANSKRLSLDEKFKLDAKTFALGLGGTAVMTSLFVVPIIGSNYITKKNAEKDNNTVNFYQEQKYLANEKDDFFVDYKNKDEKVERLIAYIDISDDLNDLKLDQYPEITCFDDAILFKEPETVNQLIEDYKETKHNLKHEGIVGDDVITFNHQVYELKELEKMYNQKIYDGYESLEEYGKLSIKTYLSDIYHGNPDEYRIQLNDYQHDGYKEITGPGITNKTGFDSDVLKYVDTLAAVYKADNATDEPNPEEYNAARNEVIKNAVVNFDKYGANIIEDIEKQQKKELKESQEEFNKYWEMNKSK